MCIDKNVETGLRPCLKETRKGQIKHKLHHIRYVK